MSRDTGTGELIGNFPQAFSHLGSSTQRGRSPRLSG
jgi:hypothetical protein